jgi:predicted lipopolysaccharide heptosyltransferase III
VSSRVSDQRRYSGDAHRRGHGRTLIQKILLIRLRLIGDVVFTTPAIAALRRHYPHATISYLVERAAAPVVQGNPHLDHVIVVERPRGWRRVVYDIGLARRLRRERFDLVIDFHGGPRSAWLTRFTGAARRIGYDLPGRFGAYTERLPWSPSLVPPRHSVDNQNDLLKPLGIAATFGNPPVEMPVVAEAADRVRERLHHAGLPESSRLIVIHASASSPFRRWPAERFAELAATLVQSREDVHVVFTSGPSERSLHAQLTTMAQQLAGAHGKRVLWCDDFDLPELRAVVDRAAVYIGGDSGPLHIASTTRTPIVALFGPTVAERSMPWRDGRLGAISVDAGPLSCRPCDQRQCVHGDFRCLTGITVERVATAALSLLDRRGE